MFEYKSIQIVFFASILLCGMILAPYVQSMKIIDGDDEISTSSNPGFYHNIKTSLRNHIDQILSIIEDKPILQVIIDRVESTPIWQKVSSLLFDSEDNTNFLKQQHAYKIKTSLD
jgi:hypothetical protein